ncbi:MAG TPA: 6-phosphogluconolactonase [Marinobacter sp.]|nr:6-phosphogluconolactonase [Marinobacter sp.]
MKMPEISLPDGIITRFGKTADQVAAELAETVADTLMSRLQNASRASLVVSGGSTPIPFFKLLAEKVLNWSRVDVLLADERWVDETDTASNTRLVKEHLLQGQAGAARFLSIKQPGATPSEGLLAVKSELEKLTLPLDVLILGMGNDGHTASLFPDAPELERALDPENTEMVTPMTPPSQPHKRITLTWSSMCNARFIALHLKGKDKLSTLEQALTDIQNVNAMPVRRFLRSGLEVFWSP